MNRRRNKRENQRRRTRKCKPQKVPFLPQKSTLCRYVTLLLNVILTYMHFIVAQAPRVAHHIIQVFLLSPLFPPPKKKESKEGREKRRGRMWTVLEEQPGQGLLSLL